MKVYREHYGPGCYEFRGMTAEKEVESGDHLDNTKYVKYEDVVKLLKITERQLIANHDARMGWRGCVKFIREVMGG